MGLFFEWASDRPRNVTLKQFNQKSNYCFFIAYKAFSKIPEARITPIATIKIPRDLSSVIVSPKKTKPPIKANMGVKAPNAAV